ncbi:hypothetical protein RSAG8_10248, partial [Rhizoctonia solani AG-8 WAC10335]
MSTFIEMNLAVYRTERRSKVTRDNSGDWVPYYVLAYGTLAETNEVLSPVCYLDDIDIYNCIIAERGGNITLSKLQRNPNKKHDCTFRITFEGGDHSFRGVLQDDKGEWEWKGVYLCNQQKTHLKSHAPQVPYSHSLFEIKKHSPSDTDSSPSSQSGSDFISVNPNRPRGSGGGSYACSIRSSVYGVIPLVEEPDDDPPMHITSPNKYDALIKEWSSISAMEYAQVEKSEFQQKTHLKSHAPQVPYSHSLFEIKKHSPSDTDSSPSSQSGSDFISVNPNPPRGSGGGSYACSIRSSVYGVIPLVEEPDDDPPMQITTPNKYDALIKEWSSISAMEYAQVEKSEYNTLPKLLGNDLKYLTLPNPWPHNQLSIPSPTRSRSRMKLICDPNSLHIPRSFTPFTEASEDSFYSIDTEDIPVSSSEYTDSGATIQ